MWAWVWDPLILIISQITWSVSQYWLFILNKSLIILKCREYNIFGEGVLMEKANKKGEAKYMLPSRLSYILHCSINIVVTCVLFHFLLLIQARSIKIPTQDSPNGNCKRGTLFLKSGAHWFPELKGCKLRIALIHVLCYEVLFITLMLLNLYFQCSFVEC